jgi:hypothetical protein
VRCEHPPFQFCKVRVLPTHVWKGHWHSYPAFHHFKGRTKTDQSSDAKSPEVWSDLTHGNAVNPTTASRKPTWSEPIVPDPAALSSQQYQLNFFQTVPYLHQAPTVPDLGKPFICLPFARDTRSISACIRRIGILRFALRSHSTSGAPKLLGRALG